MLLTADEVHATVEVKANFIRPGPPGVMEAERWILHKSGRVAVSEVSVSRNGKPVAKAQGAKTQMVPRRE